MEGGALFKVWSEAMEQVLAAFAVINLRKNRVGGYNYNNANMLISKIKWVMAEQLFEDSTDGMKGDRINHPGAVATPTADMLVAKLLFNGVISIKGARFMSNFYLMTSLKCPKFNASASMTYPK